MATRYTANTEETTSLTFSFKKNGSLYNAHEVRIVTIHSSLAGAQEDDVETLIETLYGYDTNGYAEVDYKYSLPSSVVPVIPTEQYSLNITIDGGTASDVLFNISSTDSWSSICTKIGTAITGASCALSSGNIRITSDTSGLGSAIIIANGTTGTGGGFLTAMDTALSDTAVLTDPVDGVDAQILNTTTGMYAYTVSLITTPSYYYDKIFITAIDGAEETSYINKFNVVLPCYSGFVPYDGSLCRVYGRLVKGNNRPMAGTMVFARSSNLPGLISGTQLLLTQDPIKAITDDNGYFYLDLLRNGEYIVTVKEAGFHSIVKIPNQDLVELFSLSGAGELVDPTPSDVGQTNW